MYFAYRAWMAFICGWISCILRMEVTDFWRSGNIARLIRIVSATIAQPQLPMYWCTHLSAPSSGTASQENMPKLMTRTNSVSSARRLSNAFGPKKNRWLVG